MTLPIHPLAEMLPLIEGKEFADLVGSIRANGLRDPITLYNDTILDGRNRYRACVEAEVEPRFEYFVGDPYQLVADRNVHRRHLTPGQRAMIAARMAELSHGGDRHSEAFKNGVPSLKKTDAAKLMKVNKDTVSDARRVLNGGTPEEIASVDKGAVGVSTLADQIRVRSGTKQQKDKKPSSRSENAQAKARVWHTLKEGLFLLSGLPNIQEVAVIAKSHDKLGFIDEKLLKVIATLQELNHEWRTIKATNGTSNYDDDRDGSEADEA